MEKQLIISVGREFGSAVDGYSEKSSKSVKRFIMSL